MFVQENVGQTFGWLLVREILQELMRGWGWGPKFEAGMDFATPLAQSQATFSHMPRPS
jgi:hypothetical protein